MASPVRGEITAILDPSVHLDVPGDPAADPQVLVLDHSKDKQKIGLRVGEVYGVEEYRESLLSDTDDVPELETAGVGEQAIAALLRRPSEESEFEPVGLIDVDELVRLSRQF
jgi:chemotaxis signal transduction protein